MVVAQQQGQVGCRSGGREGHRADSEVLDALQTGGVAVGIGGQHHLGAAPQHLDAHLVGVADDQRGPVSGLAQHVCAGPDTDQHGLVLLDERLERFEVLGCVGLLGNDHHVPAVQVHVDVRDSDAVDEQRALAADELDGVAGEGFQVRHEATLGVVHQLVDLLIVALGAHRDAPVTRVDPAVVQPDPRPVFDLLEDFRPGLVDEHHPVGDEHFGPQVRVAPRDGRRGVDHAGDLRLDQRIRGDPVQILGIENDDVARADAAQQPIDVAVHSSSAGHSRTCTGIAGEQSGHLHAPILSSIASQWAEARRNTSLTSWL